MLARPSHPRGSVLILVIAVLVLLALMGTAYIATSTADRSSSVSNANVASVDALAEGVLETVKARLVNERVGTDRFTGALTLNPVAGLRVYGAVGANTDGSPMLASRVPYAPGTGGADAVGRWFTISAPLNASEGDPGTFANPLVNTTGTYTALPTSTGNMVAGPGAQFLAATYAPFNNPVPGAAAVNGVVYPAFTSPGSFGTGFVIAADADGDGVADAGLSPLPPVADPAYSGVAFFAGVRVVDNNSAINLNTAWTSGPDRSFAGGTPPAGDVRNNRLFPTAIGLEETLASFPTASSVTGGANNQDLQGYRTGTYPFSAPAPKSGTNTALDDAATPISDMLPVSTANGATFGRPRQAVATDAAREDFQWNSQHELLWHQLGMRLGNPGFHRESGTADPVFAFRPLPASDDVRLASGYVLRPNSADRSIAEQLIPNAFNGAGTPFAVPTSAYAASRIGTRSGTLSNTWFSFNFDYDLNAATNGGIQVRNLRPLAVTRNPVSHATTFKPLPWESVLPPSGGPAYARMNPYVPLWTSVERYSPGEVVYRVPGAGFNGGLFVNAFSGRTDVNIDPATVSNVVANASAASFGTPWMAYTGPVVPRRVNANTAPFEDLWRAFYLTMSAERIDPADTNGPAGATYSTSPSGSNGTVSPFGVPRLGNGTGIDMLPTYNAELYRGMGYSVATPTATLARPTGPTPSAQATYNPNRMFRSNVKDFSTGSGSPGAYYLPPAEMVKLRAAQAAVNTEYLRRVNAAVNDNLIVRRVAVRSNRVAAGAAPDTEAVIYSHGRFPYITEVLFNNDAYSPGGTPVNPTGYIAIELYNPYPFPISLANWQLAYVARTPGTDIPAAGRAVTVLATFNAGGAGTAVAVVPANGYLILENLTLTGDEVVSVAAAPAPATARPVIPGAPGMTAPGTIVHPAPVAPGDPPALNRGYVPQLSHFVTSATPGELVLLRPPNAAYNAAGELEAAAIASTSDLFVPVDSFDFSGTPRLVAAGAVPATGAALMSNVHYARPTDNWKFVYPGRYDGTLSPGTAQQGVVVETYDVNAGQDPSDAPIADLTMSDAASTSNPTGTYTNTFPIQIANLGFGGPNSTVTVNTTNSNRFPFGGFLRETDLLQVPFISPVRLKPVSGGAPTNAFDLISLTQDAAFAEDTDTHNDAEENIGRFTPIAPAKPSTGTTGLFWDNNDDFDPVNTWKHRYAFANRLFDFVTVRSASDVAMPNAAATKGTSGAAGYSALYPDDTGDVTLPQPVAADPADQSVPNRLSRYGAGTEGLVNINTAPLPVLGAVPWVRTINPDQDRVNNMIIARAIIDYRQANGPFRSIFELNRVPGFRTRNGTTPTDNLLSSSSNAVLGLAAMSGSLSAFGIEPAAATAGTTPAFSAITHLTNDNGDFTPWGSGATRVSQEDTSTTIGLMLPAGAVSGTAAAVAPRNAVNDFESQFLMLGAVSNLITVRSDTFTAYVVIEGWENSGTPNARRVYQRRYAYLLDRSDVAAGVPLGASGATGPFLLNAAPPVTPASAAQSTVVTPGTNSRLTNTTLQTVPVPAR